MNWRAILAGGVSVTAIAVVGIAVASSPSTPATAAAPAAASASPIASTPASAPATGTPAPTVALPTSVSIPAIKAMSSLIPLGVNPDLTVQVPDVHHPEQAGYFALGARPGEIGSAVLLGHVDGDGRLGIFNQIGKLNLGDLIQVGRADGSTVTFKVTRVQTVLKANFPSADVYGPTTDAEIRLVTCGGTLDKAAHNYLSSVIVSGKLA